MLSEFLKKGTTDGCHAFQVGALHHIEQKNRFVIFEGQQSFQVTSIKTEKYFKGRSKGRTEFFNTVLGMLMSYSHGMFPFTFGEGQRSFQVTRFQAGEILCRQDFRGKNIESHIVFMGAQFMRYKNP